jgi:DNA-binding protein Fis
MTQTDWDITTAAHRLGLTYQGLRKRLIRYDWMDEVERRRR